MSSRGATKALASAASRAAAPPSPLGLRPEPFVPPAWLPAALAGRAPPQRLALGRLFTPLQPWRGVPGLPEGCELYIKRDDLSGAWRHLPLLEPALVPAARAPGAPQSGCAGRLWSDGMASRGCCAQGCS